MTIKIDFTKEEINKVKQFAEEIKYKHPHFKDRRNTNIRSLNKVKEDVILGKLAEVAVYKYLKSIYGDLVSEVDFNLYAPGVADDYDIKVGNKTISIKASKPNSSVLMIEKEKFEFDNNKKIKKVENKIPPDYFTFVRIELSGQIYAEIVGGLSLQEFESKMRFMPRGMVMNRTNAYDYLVIGKELKELRVQDKGSPLLADNYGVHASQLSL